MQGLTSLNWARFSPGATSPPARSVVAAAVAAALAMLGGCAANRAPAPGAASGAMPPRPSADWTIASKPDTARPPFAFNNDDDHLLDEIQRASFWYLSNAPDPLTAMVHQPTGTTKARVPGVD